MLDSQQIISLIRSSPTEREKAVILIASDKKLKSDILTYIRRNNGTEHDGLTIFNDSIIIFVKKVFAHQSLTLTSGVEGYLFGVARILWANKLKIDSNKSVEGLEEVYTIKSSEDTLAQLMSNERTELVKSLLSSIGLRCRQVLMYWSYGHSMKMIAESLNYASEGMVRKKKHQCLQKLKSVIKNNESLRNSLKY